MDLVNCEKKEKGIVDIIVRISPEEFESTISKVFAKNKNRLSVPGFRMGKAPRKIVEKKYGASIFHSDAIEMLLPQALSFAIQETKLKIIGQPQVADLVIKEDNAGADITITATVYPEVTLGNYKGLSVVKPDIMVLDSEIDNEINIIRNRNARYEKADRPLTDGDMAVIDYEGFVGGKPFEGGNGEDFELNIGSDTFIPGFEEKIIGMTVGEERSLDLVFPQDYNSPLAGKPVMFKVKLNEIKEKILPDLDDEFVKDVSEFDTLDEYKADIRKKLLVTRQKAADEDFESALLEKLINSMEVDIPDVFVEEEMDREVVNYTNYIKAYGMEFNEYLKMMNTTPEIFRESTRENSEKQVKIRFALEKIADLEGIEANDEQIEDEYIRVAANLNMEVDKLKESASKQRVAFDVKLQLASKFIIAGATAVNSEQ